MKITPAVVGQTPWSARDPLVPLFEPSSDSHQADEGVGLQTRGSAPLSILIDVRQVAAVGFGYVPGLFHNPVRERTRLANWVRSLTVAARLVGGARLSPAGCVTSKDLHR